MHHPFRKWNAYFQRSGSKITAKEICKICARGIHLGSQSLRPSFAIDFQMGSLSFHPRRLWLLRSYGMQNSIPFLRTGRCFVMVRRTACLQPSACCSRSILAGLALVCIFFDHFLNRRNCFQLIHHGIITDPFQLFQVVFPRIIHINLP